MSFRHIKCVVACTNSAGSPDFFGCVVQAELESIGDGEHYDDAREAAAAAGYEKPFVVFDEDDGPRWLFEKVHSWSGPPDGSVDGVREIPHPDGKPPGRIVAHFTPQAWVGDNAVEQDDGHKWYDVTEAVLAMGREKALKLRDDSDESDNLIPYTLRNHHNGPFLVEVRDAIAEYFEAQDDAADLRKHDAATEG